MLSWSKKTVNNILAFIKLIFSLLFIIHIFTCVYVYIGLLLQSDETPVWLSKYPCSQSTYYIIGTYHVVQTLTTVGYGDTYGYQELEHFFQIVLQLVGFFVFTILMKRIETFYTSSKMSSKKIKKKKLSEIETLLANLEHVRKPQRLSKGISTVCFEFFNCVFHNGYKYIHQGREFFDQLPPQTQSHLCQIVMPPFVHKFKYFFYDEELELECPDSFIEQFCLCLNSKLSFQKKEIIQYGEMADALYFIKEGIVYARLEEREEVFYIEEGSWFGDYQIMLNLRSNFSFCAKSDIVTLIYIKRNKLNELLSDNPLINKLMQRRAIHRRKAFIEHEFHYRQKVQ